MLQYSLAGFGTPETRTGPRPRSSRPLPFTLRIAESPAPVAGAPALHSSAEAADFIRPQIGNADRETFVILHLDVKNQVLDVELHGLGDSDSSAVYPRQVFRSALLRNSSGLIGFEEEWGDFSEAELRPLIKAWRVWPIKACDLPHAGRRDR